MRRAVSLSPLLVFSGLIGNTVATSPTYSNATERDDNGTNADADDSMNKSASLESYCSAQLDSFTATYQSTEIATSRWTWYEGFGPTDSMGDLTGSVTSQTYWTSTFLCKCYRDHPDQHVSFRRGHFPSLFASLVFVFIFPTHTLSLSLPAL
jgi:hypothetical protein